MNVVGCPVGGWQSDDLATASVSWNAVSRHTCALGSASVTVTFWEVWSLVLGLPCGGQGQLCWWGRGCAVGSLPRALGVGWDVREGRQGESHCSLKRQGLSRKHYDLLLIVLWVAGAWTTREGTRVSAGPSSHPIEPRGSCCSPPASAAPVALLLLALVGPRSLSVLRLAWLQWGNYKWPFHCTFL